MDISPVNCLQSKLMRENFKHLRERRGWSISDLSVATQIDAEVLKKIEDGGNFDIVHLETLCLLYDVPIHKIFLPLS